MAFKIAWIGKFNPFEFLNCPVCGKNDFVSLSGASVWCDHCNTRFQVRMTAGDPGCVVDAFMDDTYGMKHECDDCKYSMASLKDSIECPRCGTTMRKIESIWTAIPDDKKVPWCCVLKTGEYCSGWDITLRYDNSGKKKIAKAMEYHGVKEGNRDKEWHEFIDNIREKEEWL